MRIKKTKMAILEKSTWDIVKENYKKKMRLA